MKIKAIQTYGKVTAFAILEKTPDNIDVTLATLPMNVPIEQWVQNLDAPLRRLDRELPADTTDRHTRYQRLCSLLRACGIHCPVPVEAAVI